MNYVDLSLWQVALVACLIVVNGAISIAFRLGLERSLAIASLRTVVQLTLIGWFLQWIFDRTEWYWLVLMTAIMTCVAGVSAARRVRMIYRGMALDALFAIWVSSWATTIVTLNIVLSDETKWWLPQYAIPLLGMVLGNSLNGISVGLNSLTETLSSRRSLIESHLCLGATSFEAALPSLRQAIRTGMIPIINSMMVVGIVSLPGMMTGQLLSGVEPMSAVRYQIVIMFLIAAATSLGTVGVVLLGYRRLFNNNHQFLFHRLSSRQDAN